MLKITVFAKEFEGKNGKFLKVTCKGKYLPLIECDPEEFYNIRVHGEVAIKSEGEWDIGYASRGDIWLDKRPGAEEKKLVHVNATKVLKINR